ncbi:RNA polymerase sigma-70 factor [Sutcliffiella halmapala]|uniref:RNA polymerase sigma-70 factor n=1 Tax=Sutcliffiella halmapala TaxID=79882 RepID=UPI0009953DF0|nr:RNA polymerase sigma-70 factor [Sutcliffiella halmapala]
MELEQLYTEYKSLLFSLAYRMLGSVMDAEDIVHEAFLTFDKVEDKQAIKNVKAYLCKITTNRCIDLLRSSAHKRETYVGTWLPEPVGEEYMQDPATSYYRKESVTTAYLMLLQQLSEVERAVFLLREVFQYDYDEIASMVDKSSTNCRQIFYRAKKSLGYEETDYRKEYTQFSSYIERFTTALQKGEVSEVLQMLQKDAIFFSDGGGKVKAALNPIYSAERIVQLLFNLMKKLPNETLLELKEVNGGPGIIVRTNGVVTFVVTFEFEARKIKSIYMVANPDKLRAFHENKQ